MSTNVDMGFEMGAVLPGARNVGDRKAKKTTCAAT